MSGGGDGGAVGATHCCGRPSCHGFNAVFPLSDHSSVRLANHCLKQRQIIFFYNGFSDFSILSLQILNEFSIMGNTLFIQNKNVIVAFPTTI